MTLPPGQLKGDSKKAVIPVEDRKEVCFCPGRRFLVVLFQWCSFLATTCHTCACAPQDPFGDVIKKMMNAIHCHAQLRPNSDLGSQNYEQWVVQMEAKGEFSVFSSSGNVSVFTRTVKPG